MHLKNKKTKIISLSDLHIPFHHVELIEDVIERHSDADICVVNGDLFDGYGISFFTKHKYIPIVEEYILACEVVEVLADLFPRLVLTTGNHEARWERQVLSKQPIEALEYTKMSLLERIVHGDRYDRETKKWSNIGDMNNVTVARSHDDTPFFAGRIGQTIFCHPEKFSAVPGKALDVVYKFFKGHQIDFDCMVMAHTHKVALLHYPDCMLIEQGCIKHKSAYSFNSKASYTPEVLGMAVIFQNEDGSVDRSLTHVEYLGANLHDLPPL